MIEAAKETLTILAGEFALWLSIAILVLVATGGIDSIKIAYKNWKNK
jgi:hypothetical protein